jgi:tRNA (cytidine32/guanosine34-2'-O)-methyltransferase
VTGLHEIDQYAHNQLLNAALSITNSLLKPGGRFVAKIFKGEDVSLIYSQAKVYFQYVSIFKPKSSRPSSVENFLVCMNFDPPS